MVSCLFEAIIIILIVLFDAVQLLSEEYAALSPDTLESLGFLTSVAKDPGLSDTQKKVFGNLSFSFFFYLKLYLWCLYICFCR